MARKRVLNDGLTAGMIGYRCRRKPGPGCQDLPLAYAFIDGNLRGGLAEPVFIEWAAMSFDEADVMNREYFPDLRLVGRFLHVVQF